MDVRPDSFCFDRAADYYDRTRSLDPALMDLVIDLLMSELKGRESVLEIGVGTGRIALPLVERGIPLIGSDLSGEMMARLIEKSGSRSPLPLLRADATVMPLRDNSFDAVVACWVLHLIPRWRVAVAEVERILNPGGIFLVNQGGWGQDWFTEIQIRLAQEAGLEKKFPGLMTPEELDAAMEDLGARVRVPEPMRHAHKDTISSKIGEFEDGLFSWTWKAPDEARRAAGEKVHAWARDRFGDMDEPRDFHHTENWRVYQF